MFEKVSRIYLKDPLWQRIITLSLTLFFLYLADGIISFWSPTFIQSTLKSPVIMGFVISFSSLVGFVADLVFPELLKSLTVKRLLFLAIFASILSSFFHLGSTFLPILTLFLITMAIWGLFYEFLGFAEQQYVADTISLKLRSSVWGVIGVFKNLAYFLGPLIAEWLILGGNRTPATFAIGIGIVALILFLLTGRMHDRPMEIDLKEINLVKEIDHWRVLFKYVWPVVTLSLFMGFVGATFWTTGTVWTQTLAKQSVWGGLFLPFFVLPFLFVGFIVAKWGIYTGKKKTAEIFFLFSGLFLVGLGFFDSIFWQLLMVFLASSMLAVAGPLTDAVYSDIVARMGRERKHMIGLTNSVGNLSFIVGPVSAGFITNFVGERLTFAVVGAVVVLVSLILLLITPKKLELPQSQIQKWD